MNIEKKNSFQFVFDNRNMKHSNMILFIKLTLPKQLKSMILSTKTNNAPYKEHCIYDY